MSSDDPLSRLYQHLDWMHCVVGGSYALKQYMRAKWAARDADVMCQVASAKELEEMAFRLVHSLNHGGRRIGTAEETEDARVDKFTEITPEMRTAHWKELGGEERFHESILATSKLTVPGVPIPVQLVGLNTTSHILGKATLVEHLNLICDLPAAVSYTARHGTKIFHVPERAIEPIATRQVPVSKICPFANSRMQKYTERGFTFV
jgi:hypothetical protein